MKLEEKTFIEYEQKINNKIEAFEDVIKDFRQKIDSMRNELEFRRGQYLEVYQEFKKEKSQQ